MPIVLEEVGMRLGRADDAPHVARLHADSWRRHYRGAYSDRYLDGDLYGDRLAVWTHRMSRDDGGSFTVLAEHQDRLIGFAHVIVDADATWGALLDNLHVTHAVQRSGIGSLLLDRVARITMERRPGSGVYLWVLEPNQAAQAFYAAKGGAFHDRAPTTPPRDDPRNLDGSPRKIRVVWSDPASLMLTAP
jgi:GNAT superfamily N-acetyltransferase